MNTQHEVVGLLTPRRHVEAPRWLVALVRFGLRVTTGRKPSHEQVVFTANLFLPERDMLRNLTPERENGEPAAETRTPEEGTTT